MNVLYEALSRARSGKAVLFCGAGFTADCLNFDDSESLGVTQHLLHVLNEDLIASGEKPFKDIKHAAKKYKRKLGVNKLMRLLQDRFALNKVSAFIADIVSYPWEAIYTTNYDDGVEVACQKIGKKFIPVNNLEVPEDTYPNTPVVHLHGRAGAWKISDFEDSCVLDVDSYRTLSGPRIWSRRLRHDFERADVVVFVGFSANDFHLEQVFFDADGLKDKAFFINRPTANPDPDEESAQEDFGTVSYIGREGLAATISEAVNNDIPVEPVTASFRKVEVFEGSNSVPPVKDIENLFIWGEHNLNHIKRDIELGLSDYHVLRKVVKNISGLLQEPGGIVMVNGDICDGKSLTVAGVVSSLSGRRPIFELVHPYQDILDEVASVLAYYPNALFVAENGFSLRQDRLIAIATLVAGSQGNLILSARSIATEAETGKFKALGAFDSFAIVEVGKIAGSEVDAMVVLLDQVAAWRNEDALLPSERRSFITDTCKGNIPRVLTHLLESSFVRDRYLEELNKVSFSDSEARQMVIAALLISNIGFEPPVSIISDIFERDFRKVLLDISSNSSSMRLVRVEANLVRTVPSIGAKNILKVLISDAEVVNATIKILESLTSEFRRSDLQQHIFTQLMRYSILSSTVSDEKQVDRFFDHISKVGSFRSMPLFWLQWHMAMAANGSWIDAEKYLDMGFKAADVFERKNGSSYHRRQLEDRNAKFLMARASAKNYSGTELFRDLKAANEIVARLLAGVEITHHPYETLRDVAAVYRDRKFTLIAAHSVLIERQLKDMIEIGVKKLSVIPPGYQRNHAQAALAAVQSS